MKELIPDQINKYFTWKGEIGIQEGLGCLLIFVAGTRLYISTLNFDTQF